MIFSSIIFLFYFLPISILIYYISPKKFKNIIFLICSLFFYSWGEPIYIFLLLISLLINYIICLKFNNKKYRKKLFYLAIFLNIFILITFKYTNFIINNINTIFNINIKIKDIPLPLGISFFTFQALSYVIDVFKKDAKPQKNLGKLCLYIFAFPQLVAGPIVRYTSVMKQIDKRKHTINKFSIGVSRFLIGLSKKVLISNPLGLLTDTTFNMISKGTEISFTTSWLTIISYALQIYFDFSGYSDMAIGLGKMFGFEFNENFNYPYISKSISEFWKRWHISLGSWFRDYVYIPMGGNRVSKFRWIINIFVVWFLTGVWHGASFNFIIWGLYYAIFLLLEKYFDKFLCKIPNLIRNFSTLIIVLIGWVFFRSLDLNQAIHFIKILFGLENSVFSDYYTNSIIRDNLFLIITACILSTNIFKNLCTKYNFINKLKKFAELFILPFLMFLCILSLVNSTYNPFIYFRF